MGFSYAYAGLAAPCGAIDTRMLRGVATCIGAHPDHSAGDSTAALTSSPKRDIERYHTSSRHHQRGRVRKILYAILPATEHPYGNSAWRSKARGYAIFGANSLKRAIFPGTRSAHVQRADPLAALEPLPLKT